MSRFTKNKIDIDSALIQSALAIVTSYNPDEHLKNLVDKLHSDESTSRIIIFDNHSSDGINVLNEIETLYDNVVVYKSNENKGLGYAFNYSIKHYIKNERFVVTFDQDSLIDDLFITRLMNSLISENSKNKRVKSIGPRIINSNDISPKKKNGIRSKPVLITSGNMFFVDSFYDIGGFNEEYFIDCVDYEFSLKMRKAGYILVQDRDVHLYQNIGELKNGVQMHSDFRMYYMVRNHFRLTKKYFMRFPAFIVFENIIFYKYLQKWRRMTSKEIYINTVKKAKREA